MMKPTTEANEITKKAYEAPEVRRVNLVVKSAVLAVCHTSPNMTAKNGAIDCAVITGCYTPAV
jgi:hypothetical protein